MKGSRPEQAVLSRDTDMSKTEETRKVIEGKLWSFTLSMVYNGHLRRF